MMASLPFMEQARYAIRVRHYGIRTEQACTVWIKHFIFYHSKRHPRDMGEEEIQQFLPIRQPGTT
jgi:hypothetical protein